MTDVPTLTVEEREKVERRVDQLRALARSEATTIDEDNTRRIPTSAYADWEVQLERLGGGEIQFEVDNALQTGNYEGDFTDDGFFIPRVTLRDRWDPADLTASPHRIRILTGVS